MPVEYFIRLCAVTDTETCETKIKKKLSNRASVCAGLGLHLALWCKHWHKSFCSKFGQIALSHSWLSKKAALPACFHWLLFANVDFLWALIWNNWALIQNYHQVSVPLPPAPLKVPLESIWLSIPHYQSGLQQVAEWNSVDAHQLSETLPVNTTKALRSAGWDWVSRAAWPMW